MGEEEQVRKCKTNRRLDVNINRVISTHTDCRFLVLIMQVRTKVAWISTSAKTPQLTIIVVFLFCDHAGQNQHAFNLNICRNTSTHTACCFSCSCRSETTPGCNKRQASKIHLFLLPCVSHTFKTNPCVAVSFSCCRFGWPKSLISGKGTRRRSCTCFGHRA